MNHLAASTARIPVYLLPGFLVLLEWVLRDAFKLPSQEFVGPTLAAAGIGLTIPLTAYEVHDKVLAKIPADIASQIEKNHLKIDTSEARAFRNICWTMTFLLILLWIWAIVSSIKSPTLLWRILPFHYVPGAISYIVGIALTEWKEGI
jgi:hypothetical protein